MKTVLNKSFLFCWITMTLVACGGGGGSDGFDGSDDSYDTVYITQVPRPRGITIENDADGNIVLDWIEADESDNSPMTQQADTISYNVYWSTSGYSDLENRMDSVNVSKPPFIHKNLSPGTTYYYAITAYYTITGYPHGWESGLADNSINATGSSLSAIAGAPMKPVNLLAEAVSSDIKLSWDPAARADTYKVSWSNRLGESGTIDYATSPFLHTGLAGVGYEYVITASNAYGNSMEVAVAAFPDLPPETPAGPGVRVSADHDICLPDLEDCSGFIREDAIYVGVDWQDLGAGYEDTGGEYDVFRVYPSGQESYVGSTSIAYYSKSFRDTSAPPESYCYYVVARNNFGSSLPTRTACGFNPWNVPW